MKLPSPQDRPKLTDRLALEAHRSRARKTGFADILHQLAADEIEDRLAEVNRQFTQIAIVTGFLDFWQARFPQAKIVADDAALDLAESAYDLVIHAMSLHWADDPVGQLVQCARALKPDGLFLGVMFGGQTLHELRASLAQAETEILGGLSPRVVPMGEIRDLGALLGRAGLALPVADLVSQRASYRDLFHLAKDLRAMGETNALDARHRRTSSRLFFAQAAAYYAENYPDRDDPTRIQASFDFVYLTGWAPSENQPKPLRPGSAKVSLAEVLKPSGTSHE